MSEYTLRVTVAVPSTMADDANALALVVGESAADVGTFHGTPGCEDGEANTYFLKSFKVRSTFTDVGSRTLVAPDFAPDADLTAAGRAQDALVIWTGEGTAPTAQPDKITAYIDDGSLHWREAMSMMGLSMVR